VENFNVSSIFQCSHTDKNSLLDTEDTKMIQWSGWLGVEIVFHTVLSSVWGGEEWLMSYSHVL